MLPVSNRGGTLTQILSGMIDAFREQDTGLGGIYRPFLVDLLKNRHKQISRNPSDAVKDRLTQSGSWYREFKPRNKVTDSKEREIYDWNTVRKGFTSSINKVIKELWPDGSVTRESLGIVAKARAMLYINGRVYPVALIVKRNLPE